MATSLRYAPYGKHIVPTARMFENASGRRGRRRTPEEVLSLPLLLKLLLMLLHICQKVPVWEARVGG